MVGPLLELPRQRPAARGRHRPRQGAQPGPAAARGDRRAPGVPGLGVRERLRLQQPRLPRVRPGRPAVPRRARRPAPALRARRERRDGAARQRGARARDHGAPGDQPLQPVPLGRDQRRRRARRQLGRGARGDGADLARDAAARLRLRVGGPVARGDEVRARRPSTSSRSAWSSCTWCWPRSTRAGCCPSSSCSACRWPSSAASARSCCAGLANDVFCQVGLVHADRPRGQELDPDRRVRRAAARARARRSWTRRSRPAASGCGRS